MKLAGPFVAAILAVTGLPGHAAPSEPEQPVTRVETLRVERVPYRASGDVRQRVTKVGTSTFSAIGVTWADDPAVDEVSVAVRTRTAAGWSGWTYAESEESPAPGRGGADLIWSGPVTGADVVVTSPATGTPRDIRVDLIDPGRAPLPRRATPRIWSRADWGADEKKMTWRPRYARGLTAAVIHHTATSNDYTAEDVPGILRSIYHFHAVSRDWGDIGYNVLVDRFGKAWEGRAGGVTKAVIGAHAGGFNTGTVGIAMIGDFTGVEPPPAQRETVARVLAWKLGQHRLNPRGSTRITGGPSSRYRTRVTITVPVVYPHKLTSVTACPGRYGEAAIVGLRDRAVALIADPESPPPPEPSPSPMASTAPSTGPTASTAPGPSPTASPAAEPSPTPSPAPTPSASPSP